MPVLEKQVRVFISSTFRDMHAERDHLVTVVFPELRPLAPKHQAEAPQLLLPAGDRRPATVSEYVDPPPGLRKVEQWSNEVRACGRPVRDYPCAWTASGCADLV